LLYTPHKATFGPRVDHVGFAVNRVTVRLVSVPSTCDSEAGTVSLMGLLSRWHVCLLVFLLLTDCWVLISEIVGPPYVGDCAHALMCLQLTQGICQPSTPHRYDWLVAGLVISESICAVHPYEKCCVPLPWRAEVRMLEQAWRCWKPAVSEVIILYYSWRKEQSQSRDFFWFVKMHIPVVSS
jgi:hypothetical protein